MGRGGDGGNDAVKSKKIALSDVRHDLRVRDLGDIGKLVDSISQNGLIQPLVMRNDGVTLVSGLRRMHACLLLGIPEVAILIPSDVIEITAALQRETDQADPETDLPMTLRERMELAHQIHSMPTPSAGVSHSVYASDVVGIPNRSYWRIRAVMNLAREGAPNPPFSAIRARKLACLMLAAVEDPPAGWPPSRIIEELHRLREKGDIPESIAAMSPPRKAGKVGAQVDDGSPDTHFKVVLPTPSKPRAGALPLPPKRTPEVSRVVASLSGVCAGIPSITEIAPSSKGELAHWDSEIRACKKHINALHALVRKASNA
ncbi:ParB N-terminal domain-containing protein [Streptomyces sp. NPDC058686]|uniref:ParB N-terminal domain-containing protein n=1 Tax=Streptomyces sp. NPDC058686 TaxID=3346599 RepID=UPI00364EA36C